ncbi:peptidyl-tRNA hydrolase protein 1 [Mortierella sp. AD031]|nr:peptidyl-tRNA hydrolase protein 1 [Mortierella sp. AD031]
MATTIRKHILVVGLGNKTLPGTRHNVGMMVVDSIAQRFNAPWTEKSNWKAEVATAHTTIVTRKRASTPPSPQYAGGGFKKALRPTTDDTVAPGVPAAPPAPAPAAIDTTTSATASTSTSTLTPVVKKKPPFVTTTLELTLTLLKPTQLMNVSGSSVSKAAKDLGIPATDILVLHDDMERDLGKLSFKNEGSANGHNGIKSCVKALGTERFRRLRIGIGRPPVKDRDHKTVAGYVLGRFKPLEIVQLEELVYDKAGDEIIRVSTSENAKA